MKISPSIGAAALIAAAIGSAYAGDDEGPLRLAKTIDVPGGLAAFDISFVDPVLDLYVFADRTNAGVDFFDTRTATFKFRVNGTEPGTPPGFTFRGAQASNDISGPDGVVVVDHKEVWAGDGDSTVKVIDIAARKVVAKVSTGGTARADEMAYDPRDHLLAVSNNADSPPFLTLIDTRTRTVTAKILFTDATNGLEQPQWSPRTGLFYVSVPEIGGVAANGGVAVIDRHGNRVTTFPVQNCQPAGLTLGPDRHALLGCSLPATATVVIDIADGHVVASFPQIIGNDEVWFNPGDGRYYLAARNNSPANGGPSLGVIDAEDNRFIENVPTNATAHSVTADPVTNRVFLPTGPSTICAHGCIAVYTHDEEEEEAMERHCDGDHRGNRH